MNKWSWMTYMRLGEYCLLCRAPAGVAGLCEGCTRDLPWIVTGCRICGVALSAPGICGQCRREPRRHPYPIHAVFSYGCPIRGLVTAFKFHQGLHEGHVLAGLFATAMAHRLRSRPDVIVPVPLHRQRLRERGYNQAHILALALGEEMGVPVQGERVERVRNTAPQTAIGMGRRRHANMAGAFHCGVDLKGRAVAIVDDVITSGATVHALGDSLMASGAERVEVYGCARTAV